MSRNRLQVNSKVIVELTDKHEKILQDMALVDESGACLQGVRMHGVIRRKYRNSFDIFCEAAEEELNVVCDNTVSADNENAPNYYVVVPNDEGKATIKLVTGLCLPKPVSGYHLDKQDAEAEQRMSGNINIIKNVIHS